MEFEEVYGNMYGTPLCQLRKIIEKGKIPVLDLDVNGVKSFMEIMPQTNTVFITLSNLAEVRERLESRGSEDEETINKRLRSFEECEKEV